MDSVPLLREVTSMFSISNAPMTDARMNAMVFRVLRYLYILLSLVIVLGGTYYLMSSAQRPIAGILFFIGATIAAYFYYVKWFLIPAKNPSWPEYVNMCPDYLTPILPGYMDKSGALNQSGINNLISGTNDLNTEGDKANTLSIDPNAKVKCVDFVGVSTTGLLKVANPANLQTQLRNPMYYFEVDPKMTRDNLKVLLDKYGLTWMALFRDIPALS